MSGSDEEAPTRVTGPKPAGSSDSDESSEEEESEERRERELEHCVEVEGNTGVIYVCIAGGPV